MNKSKLVQENVEMDMTPMIDCVFLLMIFFVLVIDLSQQNLEDLILPKAQYQQPDDQPDQNRPIINLLQTGAVFYKGKPQYDPLDPERNNVKAIEEMLLVIKQAGKTNNTLEIETVDLGTGPIELVNTPILLRADKWTEWHYVGEVMKQCSQPKAAFWKVELAMSEKDKEEIFLQKQKN